ADTPARLGPARPAAAGVAPPAGGRRGPGRGRPAGAPAPRGPGRGGAPPRRGAAAGGPPAVAAPFPPGPPRPYGYAGFGELAVLAFFGVVATCGSAYVQLERVPAAAAVASVTVGLGAVAILLANNVRDIDGDRLAGKGPPARPP